MNIIYAEYNMYHNNIDILDISCGLTAGKQRKTTLCSECALNMQDCIFMELCRCGLMRRIVWKFDDYMGGLL